MTHIIGTSLLLLILVFDSSYSAQESRNRTAAEHACSKINMFYKKKMGSNISSTRTVFYSLLDLNSRKGFNGLKYLCPVISVKMERLPGNNKHRLFTRSAIYPFVDGQSAISPSLGGIETSLDNIKRAMAYACY